jgi:hypothetical protein
VKRRQPERSPKLANGVPLELAAGPCLEVWVGDDEKPPSWWERGESPWQAIAAYRRFREARRRWGAEHSLTRDQLDGLIPGTSPYSATYLADTGREDEARRRLGPLAHTILSANRRPRT